MASHYVRLLDSMTRAEVHLPTPRLEMLSAPERERLVGEWSGARALREGDGRVPTPVHRLIEEVAAARPDAVAVSMPSLSGATVRMTYGELERRAVARARRLRDLGVGAGSVVGVCLDKSPELIVTLLAVLKAGGAYLPLHPDQPADRAGHVLHHAGAVLVVVGEARAPWAAGLSVPVTTLEALLGTETDGPAPPGTADPDAAAYVINTSGSTGRPKAVRVSHRNLASACAAWLQEYRLDGSCVHLQMAEPSFDVFTGDLVRALCSGARWCWPTGI